MFDNLSDKLQEVFRTLRGSVTLTESNIADAMRDIRLALLDADVNVQVAKDFIESVKNKCLGESVLKSVTPSQQVVKIINDELVALLGGGVAELDLSSNPAVIMLVGLHGSGKTTTAGKLALHLSKNCKKKVLLVACDVYRPAAIDQLEILGKAIDVPVYAERTSINVPAIAAAAVEQAKLRHDDVVIIDTAGRLQIDETMIQELVRLRQSVRANECLLVADAALGQEAVSVAEHFNQALGLTGFILTKLDGDARAGAALSIRKVTDCPVKFIGSGEKPEALEIFHPERLASRILGMGDVVSLVEKAAAEIDADEARHLEDNLRKNKFDFNDFLAQLRQMARMGGMAAILKLLPGGRQLSKAMEAVDPRQFIRIEAMILSMTKQERENPDILDFSRRKRIARGCGMSVEQVSGLIKQFLTMRKMMKSNGMIGRMMAGNAGAMSSLGAMPDPASALLNAPSQQSKKDADKRKRLSKLQKKERQKQRHKRH